MCERLETQRPLDACEITRIQNKTRDIRNQQIPLDTYEIAKVQNCVKAKKSKLALENLTILQGHKTACRQIRKIRKDKKENIFYVS